MPSEQKPRYSARIMHFTVSTRPTNIKQLRDTPSTPSAFSADSVQRLTPHCTGLHNGFDPKNRQHEERRQACISRPSAQEGAPGRIGDVPTKREAQEWAASIETAIPEGRHFPHAAAKRTSFDALAEDYIATVLADYDEAERATRTRQLQWWAKQFAGLTVAEVTGDVIAKGRDACAAETFTRGKPRIDPKTGETITPKQYKRSGATANRFLATLSHALSFAVKERRLIDRNPVSDISRKSESRGRTRFLSDAERTGLLTACEGSGWPALRTLVLLAITTGARRGELTRCAGRCGYEGWPRVGPRNEKR
jgi:hypothetical protein